MSRLLSSSEVEEFKTILADYSLHEDGMRLFQESKFAVIAGPAGAGKDTLRDDLIKTYPENYVPILPTTTRPPRAGEQDGITYHFREVEDVKAGLLKREFFQAEVVHNQQVSCLDIHEIQKLAGHQWGLSILITETEKKLSAIKPDIRTIFLIAPSFEVLISRMQAERMLDESEVQRRLAAAEKEISYALSADHYYCLISDHAEDIVGVAHSYLQTGERQDDMDARQILQEILNRIRKNT